MKLLDFMIEFLCKSPDIFHNYQLNNSIYLKNVDFREFLD